MSVSESELKKGVHIPRSHKNRSKMEDQACIFCPKVTNTVELFTNENYLDKPQDTELKMNNNKPRERIQSV